MPSGLTPRERVEMALNHEEPDRCPMQNGFAREFAARFGQNLTLQGKWAHNLRNGGKDDP